MDSSVLVVGAGPAGLAAALELDRLGARVRIIDKSRDRSGLSRAVGISARTLELLEPSGVMRGLVDAGLKVARVNLRYNKRVLARVDFSRLDHRYNFLLSLPQSDTERILENALAVRGIKVERGCELTSLSQDERAIEAGLRTADGVSAFQCDWLAGCDGAHSTVRGLLGLGFAGEAYPDQWSLADIRMDWPFGHGDANLMMRPDGEVLFVISMPDGRFRAISNVGNVLDLLPGGSDVTEISWQTNFTVSLRQVVSYAKGRAFLAGDAAHIHSPAGGRGMNLGIEDATVLARRIMGGGLETYSRDRRLIGAQVVRESDMQFRMASVKNPLLRPLRNALVRYVLGTRFVQRKFLRRMAGLDHAI